MLDKNATIPVWIITGFLGSGKTTILNHFVKQPKMASTALIINEFGEIGIDHLLVETSTENIIEMNNGCVCCTVRGDLADKLASLSMWLDAGRIPPVERVVIETTGLADPAPILHTLITDPHVLARFRLGGVLTVVDAVAGDDSISRFPEAKKQVALADILVISKRDLVGRLSTQEAYDGLRARVRAMNPRAVAHEAILGSMDLDSFLKVESGRDESTFEELARWFDAADDDHCDHTADCDHAHGPRHQEGGITSFVIRLESAVDEKDFEEFMSQIASEFGEKLLRVKGIVFTRGRPDQPAVVHGVQHVFFPVSWLDRWPDEERSSKIVFITDGLVRDVVEAKFSDRFGGSTAASDQPLHSLTAAK